MKIDPRTTLSLRVCACLCSRKLCDEAVVLKSLSLLGCETDHVSDAAQLLYLRGMFVSNNNNNIVLGCHSILPSG